MMLLFLGERINDPSMSHEKVARWRRLWERHGWRASFCVPVSGGSLRRLRCLTPLDVGRMIFNVLPPDNKCGSWDRELAELMAKKAATDLPKFAQCDGVILLGRRVTDLFFPGAEFGHVGSIGSLPTLCMPHPSGRSRYWNDANAEKRTKNWISEFVKVIRS